MQARGAPGRAEPRAPLRVLPDQQVQLDAADDAGEPRRGPRCRRRRREEAVDGRPCLPCDPPGDAPTATGNRVTPSDQRWPVPAPPERSCGDRARHHRVRPSGADLLPRTPQRRPRRRQPHRPPALERHHPAPASPLPAGLPPRTAASALFVKGRHTFTATARRTLPPPDHRRGPRPNRADDSDAELFKKIPDVDRFDRFLHVTDTTVVITIRGIGEMQPG